MSVSDTHSAPLNIASGKGKLFAIATFCKNSLYKMQVSRLVEALHTLPDSSLNDLGIKRSEISRYAAGLLKRN